MKNLEYTDKISEYDGEKIQKILNKFKENLNENKDILEQANKIDIEITKKKIKLETLLEIVDKYKEFEFKNLDKNFVISYKGDPYITINLFLQALLTRSKVILAQDEFMLAINEILFTIFSKTLEEFKIDNLVKKCKYDANKISQIKELLNAELIYIGDTFMYQMLDEEGTFYPYYNIMMYCDSDILEPIKEAICIYSNENHYELELVYEEDVDIAIKYMNMVETVNILVLLSSNKTTIEKFEKNTSKKLFINENPFIKSYGKIYEYLK